VADGPWYVQLMRDKVDVSPIRDQIVFGRAFAEQAGTAPPPIGIAATADPDPGTATAGRRWQAA
jgi:nitrite reductase (NADH) large subunit